MRRPGNRHLDATDAQLRLLDLWMTERGLNMAKAYLEDQKRKAAQGIISQAQGYTPDMNAHGDEVPPEMVMGKAQYMALQKASTYWVSADMVQMIEMSLKDLPDEPLAPMDIPTASGFAFLDRAIYLPALNGDILNVKALCWFPSYLTFSMPNGECTMVQSMNVTYYSATNDENDTGWDADGMRTASERYEAGFPPLVLLALNSMPWQIDTSTEPPPDDINILQSQSGELLGSMTPEALATAKAEGRVKPSLTFEARSGKVGEPYDFEPGVFPEFPNEPNKRLVMDWGEAEGAKFLTGLWRFTTQKVTRISNRPYDNPTRKRVERAKHHTEWGDVRVIDLRAYTYPDGTHRPSTQDEDAWQRWSHRWRVSPHWRRQWYPSEQRHKWVFVETYVKGPDYLPLVEKDDVRRVLR